MLKLNNFLINYSGIRISGEWINPAIRVFNFDTLVLSAPIFLFSEFDRLEHFYA